MGKTTRRKPTLEFVNLEEGDFILTLIEGRAYKGIVTSLRGEEDEEDLVLAPAWIKKGRKRKTLRGMTGWESDWQETDKAVTINMDEKIPLKKIGKLTLTQAIALRDMEIQVYSLERKINHNEKNGKLLWWRVKGSSIEKAKKQFRGKKIPGAFQKITKALGEDEIELTLGTTVLNISRGAHKEKAYIRELRNIR